MKHFKPRDLCGPAFLWFSDLVMPHDDHDCSFVNIVQKGGRCQTQVKKVS